MDNGEEKEPAIEPQPDLTGEEEKPQELSAEIGEEQTDEAFVEGYDPFREVREFIEKEDYILAHKKLDEFEEHGAEWYFVQSQIFRKLNWFSECRKSLTSAIALDPQNETYRQALKELDEAAEQGKKKKKGKRQMGAGKTDFADYCGEACLMGTCECCCTILCEGACDGC